MVVDGMFSWFKYVYSLLVLVFVIWEEFLMDGLVEEINFHWAFGISFGKRLTMSLLHSVVLGIIFCCIQLLSISMYMF